MTRSTPPQPRFEASCVASHGTADSQAGLTDTEVCQIPEFERLGAPSTYGSPAQCLCKKRLDFRCERSSTVVNLRRLKRFEILPRRFDRRDGASVVRRQPRTEWRISMSKSAKKRAARLHRASRRAAKPTPKSAQSKGPRQVPAQSNPAATEGRSGQKAVRNLKAETLKPGSKQSRVIALLSSPKGATIAAIMQATGWQRHSVRGFLAGVVRSRLKLNLLSQKVDGARVYRIADSSEGSTGAGEPRRRAA
jgi:hypothetical protein